MVKFFVNFLAAIYGLIGFFSIIPFLILFLLGPGVNELSQNNGGQLYIALLFSLGGTSMAGISIVYLVSRFNDLGRKIMIGYSFFILILLLRLIWRGRMGSKILTLNNDFVLAGGILVIFTTIFFLFHPRVKEFFIHS
ncbi:MAG: hypothetical protein HY036_06900 [Nitrospirae bacterium]|nr:hypothetical protein [Nitrospirota bacterium]MBI3352290.1 hypothetical protein [Nitrospirota bacterium]